MTRADRTDPMVALALVMAFLILALALGLVAQTSETTHVVEHDHAYVEVAR